VSYAVSCHECDATVYPPSDLADRHNDERAAQRLALDHVQQTGHTEVYVCAGTYWIGDGPRPEGFDSDGADADDLARLEHAELVELVNIAVDRLRSTADSLERWDDWPSAPRGLRSTADIIERRVRKEVSE
jgi:hypothetical protein